MSAARGGPCRTPRRDGQPCQNAPMHGITACRVHATADELAAAADHTARAARSRLPIAAHAT